MAAVFGGTPQLSCPPFNLPQYCSNVETGSFVEFIADNLSICYGRVLSAEPSSILNINQFVDLETLLRTMEEIDVIQPMKNCYVLNDKLVQTCHMMQVSSGSVNGVIFVFKKDEIVNFSFLCKGVKNAYIIRFWFSEGTFTDIAVGECLPFPCLYPESLVCVSFMKRIFDFIYSVRRSITNLMCRNSQKRGRGMIHCRDSFCLEIDC